MNIVLPLREAWQAIKTNRTRSVLTVLGVVIGISSVIVILSAGEALKRYVQDEVSGFGSNIIQAEVKVPSTNQQSADNAAGMAMGITITTLKEDDLESVMKLSNIDKGYGAVLGQDLAVYQDANKVTNIYGVNAAFIDIDQSQIEAGRFFTDEEDKGLAPVIILGPSIKDDLFGDNDALGKMVKIGKSKYQVIGILKQRGGSLFFNMDDMIIMPLRTLQKRVMGIDHIMYFIVTMKDPTQDELTKAEIEDILRDQHDITDPKKDDFAVTTQEEMQDLLNTILGGVQMLLIAIASISLIVGGVGIMNIMYVSVTERTFEIGLRKSIGATRRNILWQFLWEAVFVTLAGGVVGIVIGGIVTEGLNVLTAYLGIGFTFVMPWWAVALSVGFAAAVGLIFGIVPAKAAARLDPIEALRK